MQTVNLWLDTDSVRPGLPLDDPEVLEFVNGGGVIGAYEAPDPQPTFSEIDTKLLNETLAAQGSVVRALSEVMFSEINILRAAAGLAARTKPQFVAALKAQMRT